MSVYEVQGARFVPCMDSFLGAAKGVLAALGEERSFEDLWGFSSRAFRTQIHRTLAPAGLLPRQWDVTYGQVMNRLGFACVAGLRDSFYTQDDLSYLRGGWMRNIEKHLDQGLPAIAYGLHGPAFGMIRGFDDTTEDFMVSTFLDGRCDGPVNVRDLGSSDPPCIFVLIPTGPLHAYDRKAAAREAIGEALAQHLGQERDEQNQLIQVPADLAEGQGAFEAWGVALHEQKVRPHWGAALMAGYYLEARTHGAAFLRQLARNEFPALAEPLVRAAEHLERETAHLTRLAALFPLQDPTALHDAQRIGQALEALRASAQAHAAAMQTLAEMKK